jgi:hypothetical protein
MTGQLCFFYQDLQKPCSPDTDGNKPYRLAVSSNNLDISVIKNLTYRLTPALLAYGNLRFCFLKFTKPAYERNLQAPSLRKP